MDFKKYTIKEIEEYLEEKDINNLNKKLIKQLMKDKRSGVHKLARRYERQIQKNKLIKDKWISLNKREKELREAGFNYIAGIDEAGRGPLAGPVVAAAVVLDPQKPILGLDDSKNLTENKREELYDVIHNKACSIGIGIINNKMIDKINILQATFKAMQAAIDNLNKSPDYILVDGNREIPDIDIRQETIIDGDCLVNAIAAASIIAKVYRDRLIGEYHNTYPEYGFDRNKGYGTREHIEALRKHGPTSIHRYSFSIVNKYHFLHFKKSIIQAQNGNELKNLGQTIAKSGLFSSDNLKKLRELYKIQMQKIVNIS